MTEQCLLTSQVGGRDCTSQAHRTARSEEELLPMHTLAVRYGVCGRQERMSSVCEPSRTRASASRHGYWSEATTVQGRQSRLVGSRTVARLDRTNPSGYVRRQVLQDGSHSGPQAVGSALRIPPRQLLRGRPNPHLPQWTTPMGTVPGRR